MATRAQFMAELARHPGASLDTETDLVDFHVDAPEGKVWTANGCSVLTASHTDLVSGRSWKREAYADLIDRMRYGLENDDRQ